MPNVTRNELRTFSLAELIRMAQRIGAGETMPVDPSDLLSVAKEHAETCEWFYRRNADDESAMFALEIARETVERIAKGIRGL